MTFITYTGGFKCIASYFQTSTKTNIVNVAAMTTPPVPLSLTAYPNPTPGLGVFLLLLLK